MHILQDGTRYRYPKLIRSVSGSLSSACSLTHQLSHELQKDICNSCTPPCKSEYFL